MRRSTRIIKHTAVAASSATQCYDPTITCVLDLAITSSYSNIVPFAREEPPRYIRSVGRAVSKSRGVAAIELSTAMSLYSSPGLRSQPGCAGTAGGQAVRAGQTAGATCCIWARCRAPATSDNARLQRAACVHTATVVIVALSLLLRRWSRAPLLHAA